MPGWQSEEEHRVSINSLTSTQRLEKIVEKSKFGKVSRIESIANKIFPLSTSNRDPCYSLVLLCAWLSLVRHFRSNF